MPLRGEECVYNFTEHTGEIMCIKWCPGGTGTANPNLPLRLATASSDSTIKLWDIDKGKSAVTLKHHNSGVNTIAFSHDCEYLASGSDDGTVQLYSLRNQKLVKSLPVTGKVWEVAWSHDNQILAAAYSLSVLLLDLRYL